MSEKLTAAVEEYIARQERRQHPAGKFDKAGRWYPSETEVQDCCRAIRSPSRAYPYSYMTHCRTAEHVAHLYEVDPGELRRAIRRSQKAAS